MELKDIVLEVGDIIEFRDINKETQQMIVSYKNWGAANKITFEITKIERPVKYETIYEAPKEILEKKEKEYLEAVLRPLKDKPEYIKKLQSSTEDYIRIVVNHEFIQFPLFELNMTFEGMELCKEYTLEELGLFE